MSHCISKLFSLMPRKFSILEHINVSEKASLCLNPFVVNLSFLVLQRRILDYTKYEMLNKALEAFGDLGDDEELGPTDWPSVKKYITSLNDVDSEPVHPHTAGESDNNLDITNLKDIRERLLNGKFNNFLLCFIIPVLLLISKFVLEKPW